MLEKTVENVTEAPSLSINDLKGILTIIEVCSSRGAFRAEELAAIGSVYNKVQAFVKANTMEPVTENKPTESEAANA